MKIRFEIFNIRNTPAFVISTRKEVLNMTVENALTGGLIKNLRGSEEPSLSDLRIIRFGIEDNSEIKTIVRNPRRTDWHYYARHLGNNTKGR